MGPDAGCHLADEGYCNQQTLEAGRHAGDEVIAVGRHAGDAVIAVGNQRGLDEIVAAVGRQEEYFGDAGKPVDGDMLTVDLDQKMTPHHSGPHTEQEFPKHLRASQAQTAVGLQVPAVYSAAEVEHQLVDWDKDSWHAVQYSVEEVESHSSLQT